MPRRVPHYRVRPQRQRLQCSEAETAAAHKTKAVETSKGLVTAAAASTGWLVAVTSEAAAAAVVASKEVETSEARKSTVEEAGTAMVVRSELGPG